MPEITVSQVFCILTLGFQNFELAAILGFTSQALVSMNADPSLPITDEQSSWIGAAIPLAALVGSIIAGPLVGYFGCRRIAILTEIPAISAWLYMTSANSAFAIIMCRLVSGFCLGILQVAANVYASETVKPKIRPKLDAIPGVSITVGFLLINAIGSFTDWRGMAKFSAFMSIPSILNLVMILPNSPHYSLELGDEDEALKALKWLRSDTAEAEAELKEMKKNRMTGGSSPSFSSAFQIPYRWPILIAIILHVTQQLSGMNPMVSFTSVIFQKANSAVDPAIAAMINALINLFASIYVMPLFAKYPRKYFIWHSTQIMVTSLLSLSLYFWVFEAANSEHKHSELLLYIPSICLGFFTLGIGVGWGPIPWVFIAEGLPVKVRGIGTGIVTSVNWAINFFITKSFFWTTIQFGYSITFLFYAISLTLGSVFLLRCYPETFGYQSTELEKYYRNLYSKKKAV